MKFKKWIPLLVFIAAIGCGETPKAADAPETETTEVKDDPSANPDYQKGLALVAQNDCLTCHAINEQTTGPAYAAIATKYAGANDSTIAMLAGKIIKGGSGNWGPVPMTPHPTISEEDAKQMVKYVLLLKK
jgi:cytochrome c